MRLGAHAAVAMRRFTALALDADLGDLRDEATERERAALEPAALVLGDLELQAKYLPRRPSLLPRLVSAINSDASMRSMARIIGEDGTLLGGILQLANSSFYRASGAKPIDNLERAVSLLGTADLRQKFASAGMDVIASPPGHLAAKMRAEITVMGKVFRSAGIRAN